MDQGMWCEEKVTRNSQSPGEDDVTGGLDSEPWLPVPRSLASCRVQPRCSKPCLSPEQAPSSPSCPGK